ncbi:hypothetical protein A2U01_0057005 [Trifolium medium]|uniref:Uncharacterized protein n=1 Tax=Trifolium medium TaxID=97028 RepID=A0A392RIB9_9FABA|nr:hypothetical protein [Trifolium medium]
MTVLSHQAKLEEWRSSSGMSGLPSTSCSITVLLLLRILGRFGGRNQECGG